MQCGPSAAAAAVSMLSLLAVVSASTSVAAAAVYRLLGVSCHGRMSCGAQSVISAQTICYSTGCTASWLNTVYLFCFQPPFSILVLNAGWLLPPSPPFSSSQHRQQKQCRADEPPQRARCLKRHPPSYQWLLSSSQPAAHQSQQKHNISEGRRKCEGGLWGAGAAQQSQHRHNISGRRGM
jgi:hypothetical protein